VVNIHDAKTHLSRLIERASQGEEIILAKAGEPRARLMPLESAGAKRKPGLLRGMVFDDSFFDPLPEDELRAWEGDYDKDPL
jgi:prevent-host-death family protein